MKKQVFTSMPVIQATNSDFEAKSIKSASSEVKISDNSENVSNAQLPKNK